LKDFTIIAVGRIDGIVIIYLLQATPQLFLKLHKVEFTR
jgi:hypothetical protein